MYRWGPIQPYGYGKRKCDKESAFGNHASNTANIQDKYYNVNIGGLVNITKDWMLDFDFTNANLTYINNRPGTRYTALNFLGGGAIPLTDALGNRIYVNDKGEQVSSSSPNALPGLSTCLG